MALVKDLFFAIKKPTFSGFLQNNLNYFAAASEAAGASTASVAS